MVIFCKQKLLEILWSYRIFFNFLKKIGNLCCLSTKATKINWTTFCCLCGIQIGSASVQQSVLMREERLESGISRFWWDVDVDVLLMLFWCFADVLMRCRFWCFVDVVLMFCWCFDELSVLMREERLESGISSLCVSFDDAPLHLIWLGKVKEWIPGFSPLCVSFDAFDEREEKGQRADSRGFWAEEEYRGASRHALPRL